MKRFAAGVLCCLLAACSRSGPGFQAEIGSIAQPLRVAAWVRGGPPEDRVDFARFKGKLVLLERWATWCSPCIHEIPSLIELQAKHPQDLVVVSLSAQPKATIAGFLDATTLAELRKGLPKTKLSDALNYAVASVDEDEPTFDAYFGRLRGVPAFTIIGRDGKVENTVVGSYDVVLSEVARLLGGRQRTESEDAAAKKMLALERSLGSKAETPASLRARLADLDEQARLRPAVSSENRWKRLQTLQALWRAVPEGEKAAALSAVAAQREAMFGVFGAKRAYAMEWVNLSWDASLPNDEALLDPDFAGRCAERALAALTGADKVVTDMAWDALGQSKFLAGDFARAAEAERKAVAAAIPLRRPRFEASLGIFEALAADPAQDADALLGRFQKAGVSRGATAYLRSRKKG